VTNAINMANEIGKIKTGFPTSFVQFNEHLSKIESLVIAKIKTSYHLAGFFILNIEVLIGILQAYGSKYFKLFICILF
jgi:hypothetical protein